MMQCKTKKEIGKKTGNGKLKNQAHEMTTQIGK